MDVETQVELALRPPTAEVVVADELRRLFETNSRPSHYIGFEISGQLHVGTLMMCGNKVRQLQQAGVRCQVFLADWHSVMNEKFGGSWETIRTAAKYYREAFEKYCPGVKVVLGSDLYHDNDDYWRGVVEFSRRITLARTSRCLTILGRSEKEKLSLAQFLYPPMQAVDIQFIQADIAHSGVDQRRVHMLAREVYPDLKWKKPVALHHHVLAGLAEPPRVEADASKDERVMAAKMSKSKPWTAVFIHDTAKQVEEKLQKAYCPPKVAEGNPVVELARFLVFNEAEASLRVERPAKFGGPAEYASYADLERDYREGKLHPGDLKPAVAAALDKLLEPVRSYFEKRPELLKVFESAPVTR